MHKEVGFKVGESNSCWKDPIRSIARWLRASCGTYKLNQGSRLCYWANYEVVIKFTNSNLAKCANDRKSLFDVL